MKYLAGSKINLVVQNIIQTFVVRESLKLFKMLQTSTTRLKKKIRGRHTVASTAVLFKHLFRSSRSDLPFLLNFKFYVMREQKDNCTTCAQTPSPLIEASLLISKAKDLVFAHYKQNPEMQMCIKDSVFAIESLLVDTAFEISEIAGIHFRNKYFFEIENKNQRRA